MTKHSLTNYNEKPMPSKFAKLTMASGIINTQSIHNALDTLINYWNLWGVSTYYIEVSMYLKHIEQRD